MTEKPNIEVTLLSIEEVEEKSKVLRKVGIDCKEPYWTSSPSSFLARNEAREFCVASSGPLPGNPVTAGYGVRPVLKSDNLDGLIKNLKITYENDIEVVEYGQYPDLETELDIPNNVNLKPTGKTYYYPYKKGKLLKAFYLLNDYPEYEYNGQKFIKSVITYYLVKPVKFYVDRENSMLISKGVLFSSPINIDKKDYNGDFETSQLYQFLNNEFIKTLMSENINDKDVLDTEIESQISNKENKGHQKTYHL